MDIYNKWYSLVYYQKVYGLRVSEEEEDNGVDIAECGLDAYPEFTKSSMSGPRYIHQNKP